MIDESDDDPPQLSTESLAALQEFYEQRQLQQTLPTSDVTFEENWQLSQFWYDDDTIDTLVKIAINTLDTAGKVALISCPTLYKPMRDKLPPSCKINLFEFDDRFAAYGEDFVFYDYNAPEDVPQDRRGYDLVIADPPFLSEECLTKTARTMKLICGEKMILCTGAVMGELAGKLLDVTRRKFEPRHRNNLANEFCCFSNYDIDLLF